MMQRITEKQKKVVITDRMWARLLSSTNQPSFMSNREAEEANEVEGPQLQHWDVENSWVDEQDDHDYHSPAHNGSL